MRPSTLAFRSLRSALRVSTVTTGSSGSASFRPLLGTPARTFTSTPSRQTTSGLANILANDPDQEQPLSIEKLTERGYQLTDDLVVPGGLILLDGKPFLWDVDPPTMAGGATLNDWWKGWGKERLGIFETVIPRPEILILGTGEQSIPAPKAIKDYISGLGIQLDVMDSRNAASTFNLLQEEGRRIAAALCPLKPVDPRTGKPRV